MCCNQSSNQPDCPPFDGLGLKIAILYFLALSPTLLNIFKRYQRRRKKILSAVGNGSKKC
jgi:hypothetical protein